MFFTKNFYNSDGKRFDSRSLVFTDIVVWAWVNGDLHWIHIKPKK